MISFRKASLLALAAASAVEARPAINADENAATGGPRNETYYHTLTGYRTIYETHTKGKDMPKLTGKATTVSFGWQGHSYTVVGPYHTKAPHIDPSPKLGKPGPAYQTTWQNVTATVVMSRGEAPRPPLPVRTEWPEGYPDESETPGMTLLTPTTRPSTNTSPTTSESNPTSSSAASTAASSSSPGGTAAPESCDALVAGGKTAKYTDPDGIEYTVSCKHDIAGGDLEARAADAFKDCFHICNTTPKCAGFSWLVDNGPGTCYLKSSQAGSLSPSAADVAQRVSPVPAASGSASPVGSDASPPSDPQSSSTGSCQSVGKTFDDYTIACGRDFAGNDITARGAPSFADCASQCDQIPGCVGWSYLGESGPGTCYFKSAVGSGSDSPNVDSGYRSGPRIPAQTPSSASSTDDCSSIASQGTTYQGYTVQCGTDHNGGDSVNVPGSSFKDCFSKCNDKEGCVGFAFVGGSGAGTCYLKSSLTDASSNKGVDFAYKGTGGTQAASATAPVSSTAVTSDTAVPTSVVSATLVPTNTSSQSHPQPTVICPKAGHWDDKGRKACDPAAPLPSQYSCTQLQDGCYYVTIKPNHPRPPIPTPPSPPRVCPKVGDYDTQGRYTCDPGLKYAGQQCEESEDGCYYLSSGKPPQPPTPSGIPAPPTPTNKSAPSAPTSEPTPTSAPTDKPSTTLANPVPAPSEGAECQTIRNGRKFRLKTIVEQGNSQLDGCWLAKAPVPGLASWSSTLTKAAEDAADLFMDPVHSGIFSWLGGCNFSGFGLSVPLWNLGGWFGWGQRQQSSVADCTFSKDGGSSDFVMKNGGFLESLTPNFHKWVACQDDDGTMALRYAMKSLFHPLSWLGPDLNKCAYVMMQAEYV